MHNPILLIQQHCWEGGGRCGRQKFSRPRGPVMALRLRNPTAAEEKTYVFYTLNGFPLGKR